MNLRILLPGCLIAVALCGGLWPAAALAQGLTDISWTTFIDPNENAFTIEVPRGWAVAGGIFHKEGGIWPSLVLRVLAPDRRTLIAIGDPDGLPYSAPIAARDYVRRFTENAMGRACPGLQVIRVADRPDLVQYALAQPFGSLYQWSAAEVFFKCNGGMTGRSLAVMQYQPPVHSGHPQILVAFVTQAGQEDAADRLLQHMNASKRDNPEWVQRYQEIARRLHDAVIARWRAERRQFQQMDDAVANIAHFVGPDGRRYDLDATPHYQWLAPNGQTVGTDTPTPPVPGSTPLRRSPE